MLLPLQPPGIPGLDLDTLKCEIVDAAGTKMLIEGCVEVIAANVVKVAGNSGSERPPRLTDVHGGADLTPSEVDDVA